MSLFDDDNTLTTADNTDKRIPTYPDKTSRRHVACGISPHLRRRSIVAIVAAGASAGHCDTGARWKQPLT